MSVAQFCLAAVVLVSGANALLLALLGWFGTKRSEERTAALVYSAFSVTLVLTIVLGVAVFLESAIDLDSTTLLNALTFDGTGSLGGPNAHASIEHTWFAVDEYDFKLALVGDWISIPFAVLSALLCGLIAVFSKRYLHREPGFHRFYFLLSLFAFAVQVTVLAGSLDVVFIGWELVGLCSALLIAFFHERRKPVEHGLRAFITYRVCDVGLLSAVVWVHHTLGTTDFVHDATLGAFGLPVPHNTETVILLGLLLTWAAMGKGGQVPFGGWLPRAMEGPTPSSAIFYGAISVHLAPFLLLRAAPILAQSTVASVAVIAMGATSAFHGTFAGRTQTDIKSILAFASMTQVGLILIEIGLGLHAVALIHSLGHACIRSLQILSSPNVLQDHQQRERALGELVPRTGGHLERLVPAVMQPWLYRHALERGYYDAILRDYVIGPLVRSFRRIDSAEQHFTAWVEGEAPPAAASLPPAASLPEGAEPHARLNGAR